MATKITADDFFTGLLASLAQGPTHVWSLRGVRFDAAVASAFDAFSEMAPLSNLDVMFRIRTHKMHGDSVVVRDSLYSAAQRDLVSLDNPEYQTLRLKIGRFDGSQLLEQIPGGTHLFSRVADAFREAYERPPV